VQKEIKVTVRGLCSMLQHKRVNKEKSGLKKTAEKVDYSKQWKASLYCDKKGCYIPSDYLQACISIAGKAFSFKGKKTFKSIIDATLIVSPEKLYLGKKKPDKIHECFGVIQRNQVAIYRPLFNKGWEVKFDLLLLDTEQLPIKTVKELLVYGGRFVGIGDWRPRFGRFEVVSFK